MTVWGSKPLNWNGEVVVLVSSVYESDYDTSVEVLPSILTGAVEHGLPSLLHYKEVARLR